MNEEIDNRVQRDAAKEARTRIALAPPTVANGEVSPALSESRKRAFETGLLAYHEQATELEQLKSILAEKNTAIHELKVELEGRDKEISQWRERCQTMQQERDRAVQEHAVLWTLIVQIKGTLETAGVAFQPQDKVTEDPQEE